MKTLVTALYAEGPTDRRFLPTLVQRATADLLMRQGQQMIDVLPPIWLEPTTKSNRADDILAVSQKAHGYHILFIHADADQRTKERAYNERIAPGIERIEAAHLTGKSVCRDVTPIIPVQMIEAWLLADAEALRTVLGSSLSNTELGILTTSQQIERIANPKELIDQICRRAYASRSRRRRKCEVGELFQPLAEQIQLEQLRRLPAFNQFMDDLTRILAQLNFLRL